MEITKTLQELSDFQNKKSNTWTIPADKHWVWKPTYSNGVDLFDIKNALYREMKLTSVYTNAPIAVGVNVRYRVCFLNVGT